MAINHDFFNYKTFKMIS